MEMSEPSAGGDASSSVADQSSAEGKKALDTDKDYAQKPLKLLQNLWKQKKLHGYMPTEEEQKFC